MLVWKVENLDSLDKSCFDMSFIALHLNGFQLGDELSLVKGKTISSGKKKKKRTQN